MPDPFNPFGGAADPFGDPFARRRQPALVQPLAAPEQESVLSRIGQGMLGGLGWLGESLDKGFGGRTVRGLIDSATGGDSTVGGSLAHLIPFSDSLGITSPEDAVSGKQLLGFDKHDDSWGGFLGGLGAEIALDPATYLTFGGAAATKLGKAAEKAGVMPRSLGARVRGLAAGTPEADSLAHMVFNAPRNVQGPMSAAQIAEVTNKPLGGAMTFGGNVIGGERLANAADKAKDFLTYNRVSRDVAPLVDSTLHQFGPSPTSEIGQREARRGAEALAKQKPGILISHFDEVKRLEDAGLKDEAATLRRLMEGQQGPLPAGQQVIGDVAHRGQEEYARLLDEARRQGVNVKEYVSQFENQYSHRQMTPDAIASVAKSGDKKFATFAEAQKKARINELDVPGSTDAINQILKDPQAVTLGSNKAFTAELQRIQQLKDIGDIKGARSASRQLRQDAETARQYVRNKLGYNEAEHLGLEQAFQAQQQLGHQMAPDQLSRLTDLRTLKNNADYLSKWATKLPDDFRPSALSQGKDFFGNHPLGDLATYKLGHSKMMEGANIFYNMAAEAASPTFTEGAKSIAELIHPKNSGLRTTTVNGTMVGSIPQIMQRLEAKGVIPAGSKPSILKRIYVAPEVAHDLTRFGQSFAMPENLKPILQAWDYMTNLTKTGQTVLWPGYHARNSLSALWQNFVGGAHYPGTGGMDFVSGIKDSLAARSGKAIPWANTVKGLEGLSPEDATRRILELAYAHGAREPAGKTIANELLGRAPHEVGAGELATFAGRQEKPVLQSIKEGLGIAADPTNQPGGMLGRWNPFDYANFAPAKAGREVAQASDDVHRMAGFLGYLRQGFDPETAAMKIKGLHWSGGGQNFAPFEREVMRRLIPFYGWTRQNLPFQLQQILERPGGKVANTLSGVGQLRQQQGMLPDWIGEGPAVPIGEREGNTQRYLSSFGLPFEDLNRIVSTGPNAVRRTMQQMLGDLNPMLKGPLEYATGMQLYSGRQLDDLYSRTGMGPAVDQIVMNSPISRALTMASTAADPRKGLTGFATNFFSPFRVTDVDMQRAGDIQARRLIEDELKANPDVRQFLQFYLTPEQARTVDPRTLETIRMYRTLVDQAKARSQAQRAPAQQQPFQFGR